MTGLQWPPSSPVDSYQWPVHPVCSKAPWAGRLLRLMVHQKLAPEAANFAEEMLPRLHEEGEAIPVTVTSSSAGWHQAA